MLWILIFKVSLHSLIWCTAIISLLNYVQKVSVEYIGLRNIFGFAIDDFSVTAATLGTEGFFASNYAVYPNPANNVLNINSKNTSVFEQVQLTDVNGRIVKSEKTSGVITYQMNIADLNAGVYFLKVTSNQGSSSTKIIKK